MGQLRFERMCNLSCRCDKHKAPPLITKQDIYANIKHFSKQEEEKCLNTGHCDRKPDEES